jgi:hypothetical protein
VGVGAANTYGLSASNSAVTRCAFLARSGGWRSGCVSVIASSSSSRLSSSGPPLPRDAHVYADSGYQGLQDDHSGVEIPYKKSKARPLTKEERAYNHALSRFRVRVEHSIGRLKSFRILSERYRYPKARYAVKISIVAGIINIAAGF